jgi:hypothetical protein
MARTLASVQTTHPGKLSRPHAGQLAGLATEFFQRTPTKSEC